MSADTIDPTSSGMTTTMQSRRYQIELRGPVDRGWLAAFDLSSFSACEAVTILELWADQAALRGILNRVWDLNLDVLSVIAISAPDARNGGL